MQLKKNKNFFELLIICVSVLVYFINYYFRDYLISGSQVDFYGFVFRNIQYFKEDFLKSILNYGKLGDANWPLLYILHAYLNPLSGNINFYLFSTTIIGFLTFLILSLTLNNLNFNRVESIAFASLILLLPWFNGRAHWGTSANLGWFFLLITFYFYTFYKNKKFRGKLLSKNTLLFLICLFSALSLYSRLSFIFFSIFFFLTFLFSNEENKYKFRIIIYYFFLSIPGLMLIYIWGGIYDYQNREVIVYTHSYKNILENIPIIFNYFFFYLWPIIFIEFYKKGFKYITKEYLKIIFYLILIYSFLFFNNSFDYLSQYTFGGGAILKFGYLIKDNNIMFLIASILGGTFIISILKENKKNILLFVILFIIYGYPKYLFQDYFEPLIFILFYCGLIQSKKLILLKKNFTFLSLIYFFYFLIYNLSTIIYKIYIY